MRLVKCFGFAPHKLGREAHVRMNIILIAFNSTRLVASKHLKFGMT